MQNPDAPTFPPRRSARTEEKTEKVEARSPIGHESSVRTPPEVLDASEWEALKAEALDVLSRYTPPEDDRDSNLVVTYQASPLGLSALRGPRSNRP
jgi:hypothetical protein